MKCPICHGDTAVLKGRNRKDLSVAYERLRHCETCLNIFTTEEKVSSTVVFKTRPAKKETPPPSKTTLEKEIEKCQTM